MEFRILGPVEIVANGTRVTVAPKERMLLALLLVSAGQVVPVDRLIHESWGSDPPTDARNAVQMLAARRFEHSFNAPARSVLRIRRRLVAPG